MNFTIISLSMSSICSFSPLFIKNRNIFYKLMFNNYISTIIFNPEKLLLEKSSFSNGIGGILYSNNIGNSIKEQTSDFIEKEFTNSNLVMLNPPNEKSLIIVRDCIFNKI